MKYTFLVLGLLTRFVLQAQIHWANVDSLYQPLPENVHVYKTTEPGRRGQQLPAGQRERDYLPLRQNRSAAGSGGVHGEKTVKAGFEILIKYFIFGFL